MFVSAIQSLAVEGKRRKVEGEKMKVLFFKFRISTFSSGRQKGGTQKVEIWINSYVACKVSDSFILERKAERQNVEGGNIDKCFCRR